MLAQLYNKYIIYSNLLVKVYFRPHARCRSLKRKREKEREKKKEKKKKKL